MDRASEFFPIILTDLNKPWEKVLHLGTRVTFHARQIAPGSSPYTGLYYIVRGRIRLSGTSVNGQEKVMLYMGRGTLFNEIPMLQFVTGHGFTCMEHTVAVYWPKKLLSTEFIKEYPELILNLMESMSLKSRNFHTQLSSMHGYGAFTNVCRVLYSMYLFNREGKAIVPQLSKQELAAYLGLHRSSLHKAISRLQDEGVIGNYHRAALEIHDPQALLAYAQRGE